MTPRPAYIRMDRWTWYDADARSKEPTIMLGNGRSRIIVPPEQLRQVADALHDRADQYDALEATHRKDPTP